MNAKELRNKYLSFFESKGHVIIPSASLVPQNDATVLFTTAGMQPLVPFLMGQTHPSGNRLANLQKCLRTGDIDEVGDNTHCTFFQMLGNWSLGDYFKEESIAWSYEFLTSKDWLNLPLEKLSFTVYEGGNGLEQDNVAIETWKAQGVPAEKITALGKDNFWSAGATGPCGPSSEIFYWTGDDDPKTQNPDEDERWVEIWNNVFMAYERYEDGSLTELAKQNIDTGMGFERTLAVLNGMKSPFETDLFTDIIGKVEILTGKSYSDNQKAMRIVADHMRASVFLIGDENPTTPGNVDQGYILRRFIRKSMIVLQKLGARAGSLGEVAQTIIDSYVEMYPELGERNSFIVKEVTNEETKFANTLEKGLLLLQRQIANGFLGQLRQKDVSAFEKFKGSNVIALLDHLSEYGFSEVSLKAKWLFDMFQSHGMPVEVTIEEIEGYGLTVLEKESLLAEFETLFKAHQDKSRAGAQQKFKGGLADTSEATVRLHTATHLLNEALRKVISRDIVQRGSNITPQRLRFDFKFERKLTADEVKAVEREVQKQIDAAHEITVEKMTPLKAQELGAQSEFGAKYPEQVTVYDIGPYSKEICMGPHVKNTSELGKFTIKKEESSASGIRRIKAVLA